MNKLTPQLELIYNEGERLIPGVTHDVVEEIRHRSSYCFFRMVIEKDIALKGGNKPVTILDVGCGTGHGSRELAKIPNSKVTGVDMSADAIAYAKETYSNSNIEYISVNMQQLVKEMPTYDYIVSRHAIEHVPDGLNLCMSLKWRERMMINVPFNEPKGNEFHLLTEITKESYPQHSSAEFFYEDMRGVTFSEEGRPNINSIMGAYRSPELKPIKELMSFPVAAWAPSDPQELGRRLVKMEEIVGIMKEQLAEINKLPSVRIERKIMRMIRSVFSK
jgi:SAM-dependent methyltransferase